MSESEAAARACDVLASLTTLILFNGAFPVHLLSQSKKPLSVFLLAKCHQFPRYHNLFLTFNSSVFLSNILLRLLRKIFLWIAKNQKLYRILEVGIGLKTWRAHQTTFFFSFIYPFFECQNIRELLETFMLIYNSFYVLVTSKIFVFRLILRESALQFL